MRELRTAAIFLRHLVCVWRAGQMRFRLETFGLYYPAAPYTAPAWRLPVRTLGLLVRQSVEYARWVTEIDGIRRHGAGAWWGDRRVSAMWLESSRSEEVVHDE